MFVCSKPLQALHCASIVRAFEIEDARLHVVTKTLKEHQAFREFFERSGHGRQFRSIEWNASYTEAIGGFTRHPYESLFVEDDRASFYHLFAPLRTDRMVLFEEGIGTYRGTYDADMRGMRRLKWKLAAYATGCGFEFGSGRKTDIVMVHAPDVYQRMQPRTAHKALGFPGLIEEIRAEGEAWQRLVLETVDLQRISFGSVALVLGTWGGAPDEVLDRIPSDVDTVLYKAHPHDGMVALQGRALVVKASWIPAEAYIEQLAGRCNQLTVFHFSSSAAFYARHLHRNVDFVDLLQAPQIMELMGCVASGA